MTNYTLDDLREVMRSVGVDPGQLDLDGPIEDVPFTDLGCDSLALLEITVRISNDLGIKIPDEALAQMSSPRAAVEYVNNLLPQVRA